MDMLHGSVYADGGELYFAWPSVARLLDGTVLVGCSGCRKYHVDPWGKTVVFESHDGGNAFSGPRVVHDSPLDDRDAGVVALNDGGVLLTWFTLDSRIFRSQFDEMEPDVRADIEKTLSTYTEDAVARSRGAWTMRGDGKGRWEKPVRCPVSSPHGPTVLRDGRLLYLGKEFSEEMDRPFGLVRACESADGGRSWRKLGAVPLPEGAELSRFHEPHVIELRDGSLFGAIRFHRPEGGLGVYQTRSRDGGLTWDEASEIPGVYGTPPHLLRHSSGAIVMTYGYREPPFGERARVSWDECESWGEEIVLRGDGPDGDLGYPCSVETEDGAILTVYYQKTAPGAKCSILFTRWRLPE